MASIYSIETNSARIYDRQPRHRYTMEVERLKRFAYLVQCQKCGMWSGYVSKKRMRHPDRINTICSACHCRLRHTFGTRVGNSRPSYRPKRGGHNKSTSVLQIRRFANPSKCKSEASKINRKLKMQIAERSIHRRDTSFIPASEAFPGLRFRDLK